MMNWPDSFASKVAFAGASECWLWTACTSLGYGQYGFGGRTQFAHRLAWQWANGKQIPPGWQICHRCDVRRCVNPDHLFLGTPADNMADKMRKGREARGERHGLAKLTEAKVLAVLADKRPGGEIAKAYGVDPSLIGQIRRRKIWRHLTPGGSDA